MAHVYSAALYHKTPYSPTWLNVTLKWCLWTRLANGRPLPSPDAFHQILRDEGLPALWNGTFPSLLLVFNPAIQFMFYEGLKRQLLRRQAELSSLEVFAIGAVAKAIATTLTYPLQTVQSVLRFGHERLNPEKRTLGSLRSVIYLLRQRVRSVCSSVGNDL
ncbi:hypothetical protein FKM82_026313 [Ascaphus truei]